ncbi:MBL fold metallo-hydrolase [Photobacterium sp. TY1-4]|uniref:MBL fold metallo-hydrolase n=1 Tax=Photobacterium sp. TY1-4 TaxID=2899122 RepID=UPI0021C001AF|nr:MBL fold metallo-hydrolase [Photobacterium sp. TY1-4]UXI00110.1 MBL fold metallo-hydrolase [Photobacterium sp. TY1-4]
MKYSIFLIILLSFQSFALEQADFIPEKTEKNGYVEPFQMFDDLYYVGDKWVSAYLITTSDGLVLVDSLESPYGRWIPENIEKLGLNPKDLKYMIITHGHSDHVGSAEYIQRKYGSKLIISYEGSLLAKSQSEKSKGKSQFMPPRVDNIAQDKDELIVGNKRFKLYLTPGHTKGTLSIDFSVQDKGIEHRAFIVGGNGTNFNGLDLAEKYVQSVEKIRRISQATPAVEVNLASHPHMAQIFSRKAKGSEEMNPFIDEDGFQEFLDVLEARGAKKLLEEQSK